jgi:hypothetical protein
MGQGPESSGGYSRSLPPEKRDIFRPLHYPTLHALPRHRTRDSFGRWLPQSPPPLGADEHLSAELVLHGLRCLYASVPPGGKAALARALAMKDRQQLAAMLRTGRGSGCGYIAEAVRRRCSRFLCQVERGDLVLEPLPPGFQERQPRWRWRAARPTEPCGPQASGTPASSSRVPRAAVAARSGCSKPRNRRKAFSLTVSVKPGGGLSGRPLARSCE